MGFTKRTSKPNAGNKFYNNGSNGGYSWCIQGSPTDSGCNVLANCVGYACGRFNEIIGSMNYKTLCCNAENFIERAKDAGLSISSVPTLGGIMVWQKGATLSSGDGAGHVEVVEQLIDSNTVYTSASNYGGASFYNAQRTNSNGRWGLGSGYIFRGCIINPSIGDVHYVEPVVPTDPFPGVSDEELARRVWTGEFGNGQDRKNVLGSRWASVQALVDQGFGKPEVSKTFNIGDEVIPTRLVSYDGVSLRQYDNSYIISEINGDRAVLKARGAVWAAMNTKDIKKV